MKRIVILALSALAGCLFTLQAYGQTGIATGTKYGKGQDSIDCIRALSLYQQDYKHKNFDAAIDNWRHVWRNCPMASKNLAIPHGTTMYKAFIARELNASKKALLIDTLMQVYRRGIELRPEKKGEYTVQMTQDLLKFNEDNPDKSGVLAKLEECMELEKENTTAFIYVSYINILLEHNVNGQLSDEDLMERYTQISDKINDAIVKTQNEELARAREAIDDSFAKSSAASCENMIKIYGEKFDANKDDAAFLRKLTNMLSKKECTDSELFQKASEQQYALNPSADAAANMARMFLKKEDYTKAVEYFEYAVKSETNAIEKATYNYQLGGIMLSKLHKYADAKRYALAAISQRPDWGAPYVLLANTYANGPKVGEDGFEQSFVYWVVVDKLLRAKAVDPEFAVKANVNTLINQYSQYFPKKEEAFFHNITAGSSITVGGWIGESTKVRFAE